MTQPEIRPLRPEVRQHWVWDLPIEQHQKNMPPIYQSAQEPDPDGEFVGTKMNQWRAGDRQAALDLADFYERKGQVDHARYWWGNAEATEHQSQELLAGLAVKNTHPALAHELFLRAFSRCQNCINELAMLYQKHDHEALGLSHDTYIENAKFFSALLEKYEDLNLRTAILTGTRPVLFQTTPGPTSYDNAQWGGGSLFVVRWGGVDFAVTALHVIEKLGADRKEFRLLLPDAPVPLDMYGGISPSSDVPPDRDELDDIYAWHIKGYPESNKGFWSWNLEQWSKPATDLALGQELYAAGYPELEDRYDFENFKVNEIAAIVLGVASGVLLEGVHVMDTEAVDHELNLLSGGPVFAKFDDRFYYVGMVLRGNSKSRKLNFLCSKYVIRLLEKHNQGHKHQKASQGLSAEGVG
ncbi:hypothetical protein BLX42_05050 [Pseudomonas sp. SG-MS2]|uniref:hypothetical protein n=1 Tax=Pseudomonas TaxID=286 RepID=UPI00137B42EB|nr:hypothetical protein [Pseudomonas sp. SG-MS2]KAF1312147.1 hypothetical protein BLX42_05050 [Pseudomonas sp. SG-MS2]